MKQMILDVDTGIDDALAIAYAVSAPELELLGVTTGFGNVSVEEATGNTQYVLEQLGAGHIPVVPGCAEPLLRSPLKGKSVFFHGEHGLGELPLQSPRAGTADLHAADFIAAQARRLPGQVTLVTVGALTNLALALMKEPELPRLLARVVVMGGAVSVAGNVTPAAEANVYADPEAAELVFQAGLPLTLIGLDVTMQAVLRPSDVAAWRSRGTPAGGFFTGLCDFYMNAYARFHPTLNGCALHDPLAVGVVIDPTFVETTPLHVQVDLEGRESIGRTVADRRPKPERPPNMDVALTVDAGRFVTHFLSRLTAL